MTFTKDVRCGLRFLLRSPSSSSLPLSGCSVGRSSRRTSTCGPVGTTAGPCSLGRWRGAPTASSTRDAGSCSAGGQGQPRPAAGLLDGHGHDRGCRRWLPGHARARGPHRRAGGDARRRLGALSQQPPGAGHQRRGGPRRVGLDTLIPLRSARNARFAQAVAPHCRCSRYKLAERREGPRLTGVPSRALACSPQPRLLPCSAPSIRPPRRRPAVSPIPQRLGAADRTDRPAGFQRPGRPRAWPDPAIRRQGCPGLRRVAAARRRRGPEDRRAHLDRRAQRSGR